MPDDPTELTQAGKPRQRRRGGGRKSTGRTVNLPRITPDAHAILSQIAAAHKLGIADTIEALAEGRITAPRRAGATR